jgi:phenylacetaldehyde dehydrogenase
LHRVTSYLEAGLNEGAEALVGGKKRDGKGYFVEPTVMVKTNPQMKVVREEIFGPVVVASPFSDIEQIVAEANNTEYGLAAGVWTKDISKAHRIAHRLRAGTVWINCYSIFDAALPFGGYKQSGWGREMGHEVLELYTEVKSVCVAI